MRRESRLCSPADWQNTALRLTKNIYKGTGCGRRLRGLDDFNFRDITGMPRWEHAADDGESYRVQGGGQLGRLLGLSKRLSHRRGES